MYQSEALRAHPSISLEPEDLLLLALLVGGDYSVRESFIPSMFYFLIFFQSGLHGCGILTAVSLAHAGYGQSLVRGIRRTPLGGVPAFLAAWRRSIASELRTNSSGMLDKCRPHLAQSIPPDFPNMDVISLYLTPVTSQHQPQGVVEMVSQRGPDVVRLARFAEDNFLWGDLDGILRHFSTTVFPGLALYELIQAACRIDRGLPPGPVVMTGEVRGFRQPSQSTKGRAPKIRMLLLVDAGMIDLIDKGLDGKLNTVNTPRIVSQWMKKTLPRLRVWLPLAIVDFVVPEQLMQLAANTNNCTF